MNRKEAIQALKDLADMNVRYGCDDKWIMALHMAIESLSAPSGDLISRADAIKAVMAEGRKVYTSEYANAERIIHEAVAVETLSMLPSADAVPIVYCMDCAKSAPLDEHGALWKCKAHDRTTLRHSYCNNGERKGVDSE